MQIKWFGHASFLITSQDKVKIITDPYTVGKGIKYSPIDESADIVTVSHGHGDHNNAGAIKGNPRMFKEAGSQTVKGIRVQAVAAFHDEIQGSQRGNVLIFCFKVDGLTLCHVGDLGHRLNQEQLLAIGPVDLLFVPIGGYFTIDAKEATAVVQSLKPKIVFPMHYKTARADYPIAGVEEFLQDKKNIRRIDSSEIEITKDALPSETEIVVLQPANTQ